MKITQKRKTKKKIVSLIVILLLILSLVAIYLLSSKYANDTTDKNNRSAKITEMQKPDDNESSTGRDIKQRVIDKDDSSTKPNEPAQKIDIEITSVQQLDSVLSIRAMLNTITSSGNCTLTMSQDNKLSGHTSTVDIQPATSYSMCKGFEIPLSSMSPGVWFLKITYTDGETTGSVEQEVTIQ